MPESTFTLTSSDGTAVHVYKWSPPDRIKAKAVLQFIHGNGEHAGRYGSAAERINQAGYIVYANDQRGHGKTGTDPSGNFSFGKESENILADIKALHDRIREETGLPVFLMGYSWGYYIARRFAQKWGQHLKGLALTGVLQISPLLLPILWLMRPSLAKSVREKGYHAPHPVSAKLVKRWENSVPNMKTRFDWLTRDDNEIQKYLVDPLCRNLNTSCGIALETMELTIEMLKKKNMKKIPSGLPVFIFSGSADGVGGERAVQNLYREFTRSGLRDIEAKVYPGARHNLFHETNREEVCNDLIHWMDRKLP